MRKFFVETKLGGQQLTVDDPVFYFPADTRYENCWPWNVLTYQAYHELPAEVDEMDMLDE